MVKKKCNAEVSSDFITGLSRSNFFFPLGEMPLCSKVWTYCLSQFLITWTLNMIALIVCSVDFFLDQMTWAHYSQSVAEL